MANPHADLKKLAIAYTADPEPQCWCGSSMHLAESYGDNSQDWRCDTSPHHHINIWRNIGDPFVLDAVEEIRYLRQLVEDATTALRAIKVLSQDEHSANLDYYGDPPDDAYILSSRWLESVGNRSAESAQKGEG